MSDLKMAREALERIARPLDCGCVPCRGQCRSEEALRITVEEMQSEAREALKALSAPEAAPASPSPGAWTEEIKAVRADLAEAEQLAFHRADNLHTHAAICRAIAKLSTLNATPPAVGEDETMRAALNAVVDALPIDTPSTVFDAIDKAGALSAAQTSCAFLNRRGIEVRTSQPAYDEIRSLRARAEEAEGALDGALGAFRCTQRPLDYPADHWSNKALAILAKPHASDD